MIGVAIRTSACRMFSRALAVAALALPLIHGSGVAEDYPARLARELKATLSEDSVQKGLAARGAEVTFLMPDEFTKLVDEDKKKWRQLVPAMGLHAE